jgi:large subunit ribosomal protein L23
MATKKQKTQNPGAVIVSPRVTEKAAKIAGDNVYTFNVTSTASKIEIAKTIQDLYGVVPVKVTTSTLKYKPVQRKGIFGHKGGGKKAMVFLKKGDTIELI